MGLRLPDCLLTEWALRGTSAAVAARPSTNVLSKKLTVILRAKSHAGRTRPMHELDDPDFVHFVYFIDVDDDDFGLGSARACCVDDEVDILILIRRIRAKPKKESKL